MIGIVLLLAAAGVVALLAVILVTAVGARLRERAKSAPAAESAAHPESAKPRKPPLVPWLVLSGVLGLVALLISIGWLKGCQAIGEAKRQSESEGRCRMTLQTAAGQFGSYWDRNKALPADGSALLGQAWCPLKHRFLYTGNHKVLLGSQRVIAVEDAPHGSDGRHAIVVEQAFLDAGKTAQEYDNATSGATGTATTSYGGGRYYYGGGGHFHVTSLSDAQYEQVSRALESAP